MRDTAFDYYLRTGRRLDLQPPVDQGEVKFNPYHDELGRFTFAPGSGSAVRSGLATPPRSYPGRSTPRRPLTISPSAARRKPAAEVPGFPEIGKTAWRSSNDYTFEAAANHYNERYNLKVGDPDYKTPEFLKAWAMREAGGEGDRAAFVTDPFQVNNPGDWVDEKATVLGLRKGQKMTPAVSAYSALEWLRHKSLIRDGRGSVIGRRNLQRSLERYNGRSDRSAQSGKEAHGAWYARTILEMAQAAKLRRK